MLYFNTNKPHSFFYCRIPVVLEKRKSSHGGREGGAHPLHPPPRSAPAYYDEPIDGKFTNGERELRERKKKGPIGSTETGSIRYGEKISPGSRRVPLLAESTLVCVYMRLKIKPLCPSKQEPITDEEMSK